MATIYNTSKQYIIDNTDQGLYGKRFDGYFNDDFSFFDSAVEHGDEGYFSSIDNFSSSPNNDNSVDYYSWLWLGFFLPHETGEHTFYTLSDDASWVWLGKGVKSDTTAENSLVNNGQPHGPRERSGSIQLKKNRLYPIKVMFGEKGGGDIMTLSFQGPNTNKTTNGTGFFFGGRRLWDGLRGS